MATKIYLYNVDRVVLKDGENGEVFMYDEAGSLLATLTEKASFGGVEFELETE